MNTKTALIISLTLHCLILAGISHIRPEKAPVLPTNEQPQEALLVNLSFHPSPGPVQPLGPDHSPSPLPNPPQISATTPPPSPQPGPDPNLAPPTPIDPGLNSPAPSPENSPSKVSHISQRIQPSQPVPSGPTGHTPITHSSPSHPSHSMPFTPPCYLHNPPPEYPNEARRHHLTGTVRLAATVNESGTPCAIKLLRSSGIHSLDQAAIRAVQSWRFHPARLGNLPVPATVQVPISFHLAK